MTLLSKLITSQKFLVFAASFISLLIAKIFKVQIDQETVMPFVILVSSYLVGSGLSDLGKGAAKVEAIQTLTTDPTISGPETQRAIDKITSV